METQIQESLIEKIKKYLEVSEEIDAFQLFDLVYDARNNSHPDYFSDELKDKAEERFKILNNFLTDLKFHIEQIKLTKKPGELLLYQEKLEIVFNKQIILNLEKTISDLNKENKNLKIKIENLNNNIDELNQKILDDSKLEIISLYKPKIKNYITLSITVVLTILITIANKIDSLSTSLQKFFPFDPIYINYFLFVLLTIVIIDFFIKYLKEKQILGIAEKLKSPIYIKEFSYRCRDRQRKYSSDNEKYFIENDIFEFINSKFGKKIYNRKIIDRFKNIFKVNDYKALNQLRDIFIYNLINKKLIDIGNPKDLDREFIIRK